MRNFPTEVLLSISSGHLLCNFSDMQECVEYLMGSPIFTHQFASKSFTEHLKVTVLGQHPELDGPEMQVAIASLCSMLEEPSKKADANRLISEWLSQVYQVVGKTLAAMPIGASEELLRDSFEGPLKGKRVIGIAMEQK